MERSGDDDIGFGSFSGRSGDVIVMVATLEIQRKLINLDPSANTGLEPITPSTYPIRLVH